MPIPSEIYTSVPVNKMAALLVDQANCTDRICMDRDEAIEKSKTLFRRLTALKEKLGIASHSKWKNIRHRLNIKQQPRERKNNPELFDELINLADSYTRIQNDLRWYNAMVKEANTRRLK